MFLLAHLSDPHLAPLPTPRLAELINKRGLGFINWLRKRGRVHRPEVLARVVDDLKARRPDHIAVTGDIVNLSLAAEFAAAGAWLASLGAPHDVSFVPGNHDNYVRGASQFHTHWHDFARGDGQQEAAFPYLRRRGPLALIGLSTSVPTGPLMATGELGAAQLTQFAEQL